MAVTLLAVELMNWVIKIRGHRRRLSAKLSAKLPQWQTEINR